MGGWLVALAAAGFWAGILLGAAAPPGDLEDGVVLLAGGCALVALGVWAAALLAGWRRPVAVGVVATVGLALLGAGWWSFRDAAIRASPAARLAGRPVRAWVALDTDPRTGGFGWWATARAEVLVPMDSSGPGAIRAPARLWLRGSGDPPDAEAGDRLEVRGGVRAPEGEFGDFLRLRGYAAILSVSGSPRYRGPPANPLLRAANAVRAALRRSLARALPGREAGLVMALALGDTSNLDLDTEEDFRATGLSHLVAVSGANVAMFLAPILAGAALAGLGLRGRVLAGLGGLAFFVLLTRAEPSVLRAAAMAGVGLLGVYLGRPRSPPALVGAAVLGLLAVDPALAHAPGFQLSVAATAGMVLLAGPLADRLRALPRALALAAGATVGAQAGVTPVLLFHFGVVPLVTLPANLLAFAAVGPAMLLGLAAGAAGVAWAPLGVAVGGLARLPLGYLMGLSDALARSPLPSITSPGGQVAGLLGGLALVAAAGWWVRSGRRVPRGALVAATLLVPVLLWAGAVRAGPPGSLTAVFFDVGQGDAALVRSARGATILVDGGPDPETVARKLAALGIRRVDLLVGTHAHADHLGGLPAVLRRFRVGLAVHPGCGGESSSYGAFVEAVRDAGVPLRHPGEGAVIHVADLRVSVLGPDRCWAGTESDENNDSLVLRIEADASTLLFSGDAEEPAQEDLIADHGPALPAQVHKVPHHGGRTTLPEFLEAVSAPVAVVSTGPNRYGHPSAEVLGWLRDRGARILRTDLLGDVTLTFEEGSLLLESSRG